jgi:hypothetical protein
MTDKIEQELKKGCGRIVEFGDVGYICGNLLDLCPECQARLEGYCLGKKTAIEMIKNRIAKCKNKKYCPMSWELNEVIKQLEGGENE